MWRPAVVLPSAAATAGSALAFRVLGAQRGFWMVPPSTMALLALVVCVRFWIGLSVTATALDVMRAGYRWRPVRWVAPTTTFEIAVVSLALTLAVLAGLVALILPGVLLALRWSQAPLLILDGHAAWLDAAEASAVITHGRRTSILGLWLIAGCGLALTGWFVQGSTEMAAALGVSAIGPQAIGMLFHIATDAFSLALAAAVYHELAEP